MAKRPKNVAHEELACKCGGPLASWNYLKEMADETSGQKVLVNGTSGSAGSAAVQLAKYLGAEVCSNWPKKKAIWLFLFSPDSGPFWHNSIYLLKALANLGPG